MDDDIKEFAKEFSDKWGIKSSKGVKQFVGPERLRLKSRISLAK